MKKVLKEYRIPFLGLKTGKHLYDYRLDKKFFEAFEYSEIEEATIDAAVELERQPSMMIASTRISGKVQLICDRCGDPLDQPVSGDFHLIVKFGQETGDSIEDVLILGPQEFELDLSQYLYEYSHLCIPARHVHPDLASCNQQVLGELKKYGVDDDAERKWIAIKNMHLEEPDAANLLDEEE
ncbi:MAG: DUF177 domain-containing protein [Crocinitomicaceae bacterium]|nr:DUF177 domain-containing protein [Crocinitomicaceae bacterium]